MQTFCARTERAVVLADQLGYCEAFIGEHLADSAETITSSLAFIASLADICPFHCLWNGRAPSPQLSSGDGSSPDRNG